MKRRDFLSSSVLVAGASLLGSDLLHSGISEDMIAAVMQDTQPEQIADPAAFDYWTKYSRHVEPYNPGGRTAAGRWRGGEPPAGAKKEKTERGFERGLGNSNASAANMNANMGSTSGSAAASAVNANDVAGVPSLPIVDAKKPRFIIYTKDSGFRDVSQIGDDELLDKGDADVSVLVNMIRPSENDIDTLKKGIGGAFRLDFGQKDDTPLPPLQNALAWSAIGILAATSAGSKLPKMDSIKFSSGTGTPFGTAQKVPLAGGSGQWRWAFYVQEKDSTWLKVLKFVGSLSHVAGAATPAILTGLGLPAVAWAALNSIDGMYAYLHAREVISDWLFQGLQTPVVATQEARSNSPLDGVPLRKGTNQYLVVPQGQISNLDRQMSGLEVSRDGFLVPKDTHLLGAAKASTTTATDVTYISLSVDVKSRAEKRPC
jgi:hypothetical protein